jgi:hypothetical protein
VVFVRLGHYLDHLSRVVVGLVELELFLKTGAEVIICMNGEYDSAKYYAVINFIADTLPFVYLNLFYFKLTIV